MGHMWYDHGEFGIKNVVKTLDIEKYTVYGVQFQNTF